MGCRIKPTVFLVLLILITGKGSTGDEDSLRNFLVEDSIEEAKCKQMQMEAAAIDSATSVDIVPKLLGKWVSQDCEVRPGPEFLLRSYSFTKNNSFRLLQHYYEDESCILPLYTVVARGGLILKEPSWVTPSGTRADYALTRVTVIPHTTEAAENLSKDIKQKYSDEARKTWKPHREYTIYSVRNWAMYEKSYKIRSKYGRPKKRKTYKDIDYLSEIGLGFNELMLLRTQWRRIEDHRKNKELLLGDIHSRKDSRLSYKPTTFQVPLLKSDQAHDCVNCRIIAKGTERAPPHLLSKPLLPPLPHGQWVSQRCEVRALGMFLTRKLSFDSRDRTWMGEYRFHSDPFCTEPAFAISASGKYILGPFSSKDKPIRKRKTGTSFDFQVAEASVTLFDPTLRDTFNAESNCGVGHWYVGVPKELLPTSGCSILGIILPTTEYDLIKLEIDNRGTPLLLMGLPDTENRKRSFFERPTSFQAPLSQCSAFPQQNLLSNHLEPIFYARTAPLSSASDHFQFLWVPFVFLWICCHFRLTENTFERNDDNKRQKWRSSS